MNRKWPAYVSNILGFILVSAALLVYLSTAVEDREVSVIDAAILIGIGHAYLLGSIFFYLTYRKGEGDPHSQG